MIKFFRKIRQQLLTENRFSKYLLYAIGEIVLVVIGILIALQINNYSQQKKTEVKIDAILKELLVELSLGIETTTKLMHDYEEVDSLSYLVLNKKLTYDDYTNPKGNLSLHFLPGVIFKANLTQKAYDNLIRYMDEIPLKYKTVLKDLSDLYTLKKTVDDYDSQMEETVFKMLDYRKNNYKWFAFQGDMLTNKEYIDYMLTDYKYLNEVENYNIYGIVNHVRHMGRFRNKASDCYQQIAELLNLPITNDSFKIDDEILNLFVGDWQSVTFPKQSNIHFEKNNSRLLYNYISTDTTSQTEAVILSIRKLKTKTIVKYLIGEYYYYSTILFEGDTILEINHGENEKYVKVKNMTE